jgi:hypothetical protein
MPLFIDTSALGKLYIDEPGSEAMEELASRPELEGGFFISDCVAIEVYGLFAKRLRIAEEERRKSRGGKALRAENRARYQTACMEFGWDYEDGRYSRVELERKVLRIASDLAQAFPDRRVSPMDLIHLATVYYLTESLEEAGADHNVMLLVCDRALKTLAIRQGVDVWDPLEDDPKAIFSADLLP